MLMHPNNPLAVPEMEGLFPNHPAPLVPSKAEDALHSHIITGFEEALGLGMNPMEGLSLILSWVASELGRINNGQRGRSITSVPTGR